MPLMVGDQVAVRVPGVGACGSPVAALLLLLVLYSWALSERG